MFGPARPRHGARDVQFGSRHHPLNPELTHDLPGIHCARSSDEMAEEETRREEGRRRRRKKKKQEEEEEEEEEGVAPSQVKI